MEQLKQLIERAILVAYHRDGDVDTEDGTFATTDTDEMIRLESAIQDLFGLEVRELVKSDHSTTIINNKIMELLKKQE